MSARVDGPGDACQRRAARPSRRGAAVPCGPSWRPLRRLLGLAPAVVCVVAVACGSEAEDVPTAGGPALDDAPVAGGLESDGAPTAGQPPSDGGAAPAGAGLPSHQAPPQDQAGRPAAPSEVWFEDLAEASGLHFRYRSGHDGSRFLMPEIMGGGAALLDADGDGRLDVYCVQGGGVLVPPVERPGNALFLNRSERGAPRFVDASASSGADDRGYGMGATAGDVDNDGDVDLYVTNWGSNALLLNDGAGRFSDAGGAAGAADPGWGTSAALVDVEADGDLDLFVVNYLDWTPAGELTCHNELGRRDWCSPQNYESAARDVLLLNVTGEGEGAEGRGGAAGPGADGPGADGESGPGENGADERGGGGRRSRVRFRDVSESSGVAGVPGTGLGVGCGDFDGDGHVDVFVANDGMPDALWKGDGAGHFEDVALLAGCAVDDTGKSKAGMGVALADVDDDGDLDLVVCNLDRQSDSLFINQGGWFDDETAGAGLARHSQRFTRFGMGLADFDLDGRLDLFQANGRVASKPHVYGDDPLGEPDLLQRGLPPAQDGSPRFERLDTADGTLEPPALVGRAAVFGDLDDDGAIDVLVIDKDGPARLLHNRVGPARVAAGSHWLGLRVLDEHGRDALGATVTIEAGARTLVRDVRAAYSYLAGNDPRVHVGLGEQAVVGALQVRWIDGRVEVFDAPGVDAWHTLRRGEGRPPR